MLREAAGWSFLMARVQAVREAVLAHRVLALPPSSRGTTWDLRRTTLGQGG